MAANASEPNSINTARNEPHFVSALARGKRFLFNFRLIISGNRETRPIYLSGYSFIANFAFLFRLKKIY